MGAQKEQNRADIPEYVVRFEVFLTELSFGGSQALLVSSSRWTLQFFLEAIAKSHTLLGSDQFKIIFTFLNRDSDQQGQYQEVGVYHVRFITPAVLFPDQTTETIDTIMQKAWKETVARLSIIEPENEEKML